MFEGECCGLLLIVLVGAVLLGYARNYVIHLSPKASRLEDWLHSSDTSISLKTNDKRALVIGGTKGIGLAIAKSLIGRGVHVTLVGRTEPKELTEDTSWKWIEADLSSMAVRLANHLKHVEYDAIFLTIGGSPGVRSYTAEGIESDLAVSYLSRHVFLQQMIKNGFASRRPDRRISSRFWEPQKLPRVISIALPGLWFSPGALGDINWEETPYNYQAHINTHIFNEALVHFLAHWYPNIVIIGISPGILSTPRILSIANGSIILEDVLHKMVNMLFQSKEDFVDNVVWPLFLSSQVRSGSLFNSQGNEILPNSWLAEDLLKRSTQLVELNQNLLRKYNLTRDTLETAFQ